MANTPKREQGKEQHPRSVEPQHNPNADIEDAPLNAATPHQAEAADPYPRTNSGLRAAGHGGGEMDERQNAGEHSEGYEFSGGGRGHEPQQSLGREIDEDLESRSGPYTRAGRPAAEDAGGGAAHAQDAHKSKGDRAQSTSAPKPPLKK